MTTQSYKAWDTIRPRREQIIEPQRVTRVEGEDFMCFLGGCLVAELRLLKEDQKTLLIPEPVRRKRRALRLIGNSCAFGERRKERESALRDRTRARERTLEAEANDALKDPASALNEAEEFCRSREYGSNGRDTNGHEPRSRPCYSESPAPVEAPVPVPPMRRASPDPIVIRLRRMSPERWRRWGGINWRPC